MGPQYDDYDVDLHDFFDEYPYHKLFPLSQYKFRNPCTKCLVKPMCSKHCTNYFKHLKFAEYKEVKKYFFKLKMKSVRKFFKTLFIAFLPLIFVGMPIILPMLLDSCHGI